MDKVPCRGIEFVKPSVVCPDPERSVSILKYRSDRVAAQAVGVMGVVLIVDETVRRAVKSIDSPAICPDPQRAVSSLVYCADNVVTQAVGIIWVVVIMGKAVFRAIEPAEAVSLGADPEYSFLIQEYRVDEIAAYIVRASAALISDELLCIAVEGVQSAAVGADPERALVVFDHRPDVVVTQAGRISGDVPVVGKGVSIVLVQPILCAEPHEPFAILQNAIDRTLGEPLFQGDALEFDGLIWFER